MCKTPACPPVQLLWKKNSVSFLCYLLFMPWGFVQTYLRCRFALFVIRRVTFLQNSTHLFLIQPVSRTFLEYFSKKRTIIVYYFPFPFINRFSTAKKLSPIRSPHKEQLSLILNSIFQLLRSNPAAGLSTQFFRAVVVLMLFTAGLPGCCPPSDRR